MPVYSARLLPSSAAICSDFYFGKCSQCCVSEGLLAEHFSQFLQVGWCINYGYLTFFVFRIISAGHDSNLDCFVDLGAYKICAVTQRLSIFSSILLLMMQALVSRMIVPGISNFVNASVRRLHPRACCGTSQRQHDDGFCDLWGALASRAAGAALGLQRWHGRNKRCGGRRR